MIDAGAPAKAIDAGAPAKAIDAGAPAKAIGKAIGKAIVAPDGRSTRSGRPP